MSEGALKPKGWATRLLTTAFLAPQVWEGQTLGWATRRPIKKPYKPSDPIFTSGQKITSGPDLFAALTPPS